MTVTSLAECRHVYINNNRGGGETACVPAAGSGYARPKNAHALVNCSQMTGSLAEFVSSLPEFKDANRRRALFGALPLRSVNEGAYLDRISFWKGTLSSVLQQGLLGERTVLTITPDFAQNFRTSEGIAPRSLAGVLNQMVGDGSLVDFQTFFSKGGPGSAPGGVLGLPLKWLWSFVTRTNEGESTDSVDELPVGRFVLIDSVNVRDPLETHTLVKTLL